MKTAIRFFFRTLRAVLGPVMLLKESVGRPVGVVRAAPEQAAVDMACQNLALYQFQTCPFCIKVRQEMRRLSLNVEKRDAQYPGLARDTLSAQGGSTKVPCLRIAEASGSARWLYESDAIISYLREQFASAAPAAPAAAR